jgi:hypothetical protein
MHYLSIYLDGHVIEYILLLAGKGSNGKSLNYIKVLGSIYGVKMPLSFITSRAKMLKQSNTRFNAAIKDAHFVTILESNKFEGLIWQKLKNPTGKQNYGW